MRIVICSGHWSPLHGGHLEYLRAARELGDSLWVIVNSDAQIERRGDPVLLTQYERLAIIRELRCVNKAFIAYDEGGDVAGTLEVLVKGRYSRDEQVGDNTEFIWCNGGDRTEANAVSSESEICKELGVEEVWGVGGTDKFNSSSQIRGKCWSHMEKKMEVYMNDTEPLDLNDRKIYL